MLSPGKKSIVSASSTFVWCVVAVALVFIAVAPVRAQKAPPLSDLSFLPGDASPALARGRQFLPKIAGGDGRFLAVWVDTRTAFTDVGVFVGGGMKDEHVGSMMDVYAARMNADGTLIDQTPIVVAQGPQNQGLPEVAWNGESWLVVWTGQVGIDCCPNENRYAARVSWDGVVLDDPPILLAAYPDAEAVWPAAVGSDGTNWLFVWAARSSQTSYVVRAMRIGPDGSILDPGGVVIAPGQYPNRFDVNFAGGEYFVTWSAGGPVMGLRLMPDLTPIGSPITINQYSPSGGLNARAATNGTDYFVVWWEARWDYWAQVAGARVSHDGVVLDPDGIFLTALEVGETTNFEPSVDWDGTNYVVAYQRQNATPDDSYNIDLYAARVTTTGQVLDFDADAIPVSTAPEAQMQPVVAKLPGGGSLIVWQDHRYTPPGSGGFGDLFSTTLSPGGTVGTERHVSVGAPAQTRLKLVPNGSGYLAVYKSETSRETRIMAQRLDAAGTALDPEPVTVVTGGIEITNPSAAWNGSVYLVVWEVQGLNPIASQVMGRRLASDLAHLDPAPFAILPGDTPDAAAVGDNFLIVSSWENPHEIRRIYCTRVSGSDGAVLDPVQGITSSFSLYPRVAAFGSSWLVVWQQHITHDDPWSQAVARFVDSGGVAGLVLGVDGNARKPSVTATADRALIVFAARGEAGFIYDIYGRRLLPDGTYLDPARSIMVTHELQWQFEPVAAWDGTRYLVAFSDFRIEGETTTPRGDLFGAQVHADGIVLDPNGFAIAAETVPEMFPAAAGLDGASIVGASIFRPSAGFAAYRIGLRNFPVVVGIRDGRAGGPVPSLSSGRPNPFNRGTTISFDLPERTAVTLRVVDVRGAMVRELFDGVRDAGGHAVSWDGTNDQGQAVASGVYFVRMQAGRFRDTKKLVLLR